MMKMKEKPNTEFEFGLLIWLTDCAGSFDWGLEPCTLAGIADCNKFQKHSEETNKKGQEVMTEN